MSFQEKCWLTTGMQLQGKVYNLVHSVREDSSSRGPQLPNISVSLKKNLGLDVVTHILNLRTWEVEVDGSLCV